MAYKKKFYAKKKKAGLTREEIEVDLSTKVDGLISDLANITDEARTSEIFQEWLAMQSRFHHYSFSNTMLILLACPHASRVAGADKWKKEFNRYIKADEKAIWIWAPSKRKFYETVEEEQEDGTTKKVRKCTSTYLKFYPVPVFDVSQTDGDPLPVLGYRNEGEDRGLVALLEQFCQERGIEYSYKPKGEGRLGLANGVSLGGKIQILENLQGQERASTLVHEIAHEMLHWTEEKKLDVLNHSRSSMEIEAEAVAFVTLSALGFDMKNSSFYLAAWKGDKDKVKESLTAIATTSKELIAYLQELLPQDVLSEAA